MVAGAYTVRPGHTGLTFSPTERSVTVPPNAAEVNFTISSGSYISGVVKNGTGTGVTGVSVSLYIGDALKLTTTTIENGRYYFTGLPEGTYGIKPEQTGKVFDPVSRSVTVPTSTSTADFVISDAGGGQRDLGGGPQRRGHRCGRRLARPLHRR